LLKALLWGCR